MKCIQMISQQQQYAHGNENRFIINKTMKIFFWDFKDDNDIIREWLMFVLNSVVFLFTCMALFRTWRYYRECMFEMMPLSINLIATFILLMLKLFEKGYEFDQIGHLIEIFTYILFCYTFAIMYTLISDPEKRRKVQLIWNIVLALLLILLIVFSTLVFTGVISKNCDKDTEQWPAIFSLLFQFVSFIPTVFYGVKILRSMIKKQHEDEKDQQMSVSSFTSQFYIKQRRKQITLVLATYFISLVIRLIVSVINIFFWEDLFICKIIDGFFILTSDLAIGQAVLVFAQFNQLLPHIVIPIAMYVVPLQKMTRSKSIKLHQGLLDEDDFDSDHSHEQNVQNRVSSLLTSRISEGGSPTKIRQNKFNKQKDQFQVKFQQN